MYSPQICLLYVPFRHQVCTAFKIGLLQYHVRLTPHIEMIFNHSVLLNDHPPAPLCGQGSAMVSRTEARPYFHESGHNLEARALLLVLTTVPGYDNEIKRRSQAVKYEEYGVRTLHYLSCWTHQMVEEKKS